MTHYKLISFDLCPFAQRSAIMLLEKGVSYELEYIDLRNKPDWFLNLSALGKVPVLVVDGETVLFESAIINEYLDETTEGRLLPEDPLRRAHARGWVEFASDLLFSSHRMQIAKDRDAAFEHLEKVRDKLTWLERAADAEGPLFYGEGFTLVDAATAPGLQRLAWMDRVRPDLALFDGVPKVARWRDALLERDSVKGSTVPDIFDRFRASLERSESWLLG